MKKKINSWIYLIIVMGFVFILTNSCKKDGNAGQVPVLTTSTVSDITQTTATCGGNITNDGETTIIARGVCWGTGQTPTIADIITTDDKGAGSFTSKITGLADKTTYFLRAYATNSAGTGYGSAMSFTTLQKITDIDGNVYHSVNIGMQVWMVENLKVTHYRNGDPIPNVTDGTAWSNLTKGAYCNYNNDANISTTYGRLYNWFTIADSRQIAPTGWHIPTDAEWTILKTTLGGIDAAGGKLKETGTTHWLSPNAGATNESGFTALPGGARNQLGILFESIDSYGFWWSSTENNSEHSWCLYMNYNYRNILRYGSNNNNGFSVRCLKD